MPMVVLHTTVSNHSIQMITCTFHTNRSRMAIQILLELEIQPVTIGRGQQAAPQILIGVIVWISESVDVVQTLAMIQCLQVEEV